MANTKPLVLYYSRADENYAVGVVAKGNTEIIAEMIAQRTGGDLLRIEPETPYASDYKTCLDQAKKELNENARPAFKPVKVNLEDYSEVYVGYPVWWGEMPMPMFTFFAQNSLEGKQVHPFVTHEGSGLSGIVRLKKAAGGNITKGLAIFGHVAQNEREQAQFELDDWLQSEVKQG